MNNNENALAVQEKPMMMVESAATALAAQAKANVEARFLMAINRPRNWANVRQELLNECQRPAFANNKSAYYKKPIGQGVEGLGIRFVEVAFRCMTNVLVETPMVFEDDTKEIMRVTITDLEANTTFTMDAKITKSVERAKPLDDGTYISVRKNSRGKDVFTIPATDDELLNKRGASISKAVRNLGLRLIPGDLQDEAIEIIKSVRLNRASKDPAAEKKAVLDAFNTLGVKPSDLSGYLGHDVAQCSPAEIVDLRGLHGAIKDGETTWAEVMANKELGDEQTPEEDLKTKAGATVETIDIEPETNVQNGNVGQLFKSCPDRNGDQWNEDYCENDCKRRDGCPAWGADKQEATTERPDGLPEKKF